MNEYNTGTVALDGEFEKAAIQFAISLDVEPQQIPADPFDEAIKELLK